MSTSTELATLQDLMAHARWTRALALRLLGDEDEADDVLQETWLSAMRLPPARRRSVRPWLATVVRNLVRSKARSEGRARRRMRRMVADMESRSPEQLLADLQTERLIATLVLELAEPYRGTVLLRYHQGKSTAEIAQHEGIAEGTVRWRLKQGLDEVRRRLEERTGGPQQALKVLIPLGAAASAATATKGALAAALPVLLLKGKTMLAVATVTAAVVSAGVMVENTAPLRARMGLSKASHQALSGGGAPGPARLATPVDPQLTPAIWPPAGAASASAPKDVGAASGTFTFEDLPEGRFSVTADVPGHPGSQVVMEVEGVRRGGKVTVSIKPGRKRARKMAVTIDPQPSQPLALDGDGSDAFSLPGHSRWCCHRAIAVGQAVEGRACLKLRSREAPPECEVYGLKRQVRCWDETEGHFATGDLSRTGRLVCEGQAL